MYAGRFTQIRSPFDRQRDQIRLDSEHIEMFISQTGVLNDKLYIDSIVKSFKIDIYNLYLYFAGFAPFMWIFFSLIK